MVKNLPAMQETQVQFLDRENLLEKEMATHSSILAWRIHGQRSLAGYSPRDRKESDMTEQLHFISKSLQLVSAAMKLKDTCFLEEKL